MLAPLIYNTGIIFFEFLIKIASLFNKKAKTWIEGRKGIMSHVALLMKNNVSPVLWFHSASLGEFEQGRPLIEKFKKDLPEYKILLTFFSPSGYEVRKNYELADYVFYLPSDTPWNAHHFIKITNPSAAFFIKYEFWYNYLSELNKSKIPVYSVSSIFRSEQIFFKFYGGIFKSMLQKFSKIFVQNEESIQLLKTINIEAIVAGDTRFDRVKTLSEQRKELVTIKRFKTSSRLLVIGSSWEADIEVIKPIIDDLYLHKNIFGSIKIVIAPHEVATEKIEALTTSLKRSAILYSESSKRDMSLFDILIIDNIGLLSSIYQYADFVYIGGGFGKGIHNILEAATYGVPLFFGPNYARFQEAVDLVNSKGAFSIANTKEFMDKFTQLAENAGNNALYEKSVSNTKEYVEGHIGATNKIFEIVLKDLKLAKGQK